MFEQYPDMLSVCEVQKALNTGKNTVYRLLESGKLQSVRVGNKYRVPKVALIKFVNSSGPPLLVTSPIIINAKEIV